jgi:hypothetical protein
MLNYQAKRLDDHWRVASALDEQFDGVTSGGEATVRLDPLSFVLEVVREAEAMPSGGKEPARPMTARAERIHPICADMERPFSGRLSDGRVGKA